METGTIFDLFNAPGPGARQTEAESKPEKKASPEIISLAETRDEARKLLIQDVKKRLIELFQRVGVTKDVSDKDAEALLFASDGKYLKMIEGVGQLIERIQKLEQALQSLPETAKNELTYLLTTLMVEDLKKRREHEGDGVAREISSILREIIRYKEYSKLLMHALKEIERMEKELDEIEETRVKGNGKVSDSEVKAIVEALRSELAQTRRLLQQLVASRAAREEEDELVALHEIDRLRKKLDKIKELVKSVAPLVGLRVSEENELALLARENPEVAREIVSKKVAAELMQQSLQYQLMSLALKKLDRLTDLAIEHLFKAFASLLGGEEESEEGGEESNTAFFACARARPTNDDEFKRLVAEQLKRLKKERNENKSS